jgi:hypothetical protein
MPVGRSRKVRWTKNKWDTSTDDDDVNLLGDNVDTIKKSTQTLIHGSREFGLEVNTEKTKYMLLPRH